MDSWYSITIALTSSAISRLSIPLNGFYRSLSSTLRTLFKTPFNSIEWILVRKIETVRRDPKLPFNSIEWIPKLNIVSLVVAEARLPFNSIEWIQQGKVFYNVEYINEGRLSIPLNGFLKPLRKWAFCYYS